MLGVAIIFGSESKGEEGELSSAESGDVKVQDSVRTELWG
jgi:hypothetical protein